MLSLQERYKAIKLREDTHSLHIEDSLLKGPEYIKRMLGHFNHALEIVEGSTDSSQPRPTVKWDGSPAITMWTSFPGIDGPGISTKSLFNVNPKYYLTYDQIDEDNRAEGLKNKLKYALKLAGENIIPSGEVWQGDMLWTQGDIKTFDEDGIRFNYVQPNTLAYAAPADSELGKRMLNSGIGVVFHTRYKGDLRSPQQSNDVKIDELNNVPDWAFVIDARLPDLSGKVTLDRNASEGLENSIKELKQICNRLISHEEYENLISNEEFVQFYMMTLQNHKVDKGEEIDPDNFVKELHDWITKKMHKAYSGLDKLKTKKGRDNKRDNISSTSKELHLIIQNNEDLIQEIARGLYFATYIKGILIDQFNKAQEWITRVNTRSGGMKVTNGEGFVISDNDGKFVKMVDRSAFSFFNRSPDVVKGFERITESEEDYIGLLGAKSNKKFFLIKRNYLYESNPDKIQKFIKSNFKENSSDQNFGEFNKTEKGFIIGINKNTGEKFSIRTYDIPSKPKVSKDNIDNIINIHEVKKRIILKDSSKSSDAATLTDDQKTALQETIAGNILLSNPGWFEKNYGINYNKTKSGGISKGIDLSDEGWNKFKKEFPFLPNKDFMIKFLESKWLLSFLKLESRFLRDSLQKIYRTGDINLSEYKMYQPDTMDIKILNGSLDKRNIEGISRDTIFPADIILYKTNLKDNINLITLRKGQIMSEYIDAANNLFKNKDIIPISLKKNETFDEMHVSLISDKFKIYGDMEIRSTDDSTFNNKNLRYFTLSDDDARGTITSYPDKIKITDALATASFKCNPNKKYNKTGFIMIDLLIKQSSPKSEIQLEATQYPITGAKIGRCKDALKDELKSANLYTEYFNKISISGIVKSASDKYERIAFLQKELKDPRNKSKLIGLQTKLNKELASLEQIEESFIQEFLRLKENSYPSNQRGIDCANYYNKIFKPFFMTHKLSNVEKLNIDDPNLIYLNNISCILSRAAKYHLKYIGEGRINIQNNIADYIKIS